MLSALLFGTIIHTNAQSTNVSLILTLTDGQENTYQLSEDSRIYFEDGIRLIIDDGTDNTISYPLEQIRKMVCSEVTGVSESDAFQPQILPNPTRDGFVISNLQGDAEARIYSLDGRMVKAFVASEGMMVDINDLPQGMYLLHIDGQTLKLMKL